MSQAAPEDILTHRLTRYSQFCAELIIRHFWDDHDGPPVEVTRFGVPGRLTRIAWSFDAQ
jgi:hypothetical protein